jgi:hypothetical protein
MRKKFFKVNRKKVFKIFIDKWLFFMNFKEHKELMNMSKKTNIW